MDLNKIGKFIADCRKDKKLTQEQLAEKLLVTDRAVSKWERGICLPDAGKMLDLCDILGISVNELLNGEKINMKDYNKKNEELLVELARQEEAKNKKLMLDMWVLLISVSIFYFGILLITVNTLGEGFITGTIICVSTFIFVAVGFYALKLEVDAGYYECRKCNHRFTIGYFTAMIAPHVHTNRRVRCPKCHKRTWARKVMSK